MGISCKMSMTDICFFNPGGSYVAFHQKRAGSQLITVSARCKI